MKKAVKKTIKLNIKLIPTNEVFKLNNLFPSTTITDVRSETEIASGIPANIQHLYYLDKCDLQDHTTLQNNDVVSGATLTMDIWHNWLDLIIAAAKSEWNQLTTLGVTSDLEFSTPSSSNLGERNRQKWVQDRASMALFVAAHRGHVSLCEQLIDSGANVNWTTRLGRTALHMAAARGQSSVIGTLLARGASVELEDSAGHTAMSLASQYGHRDCGRHLFMFRWQQRASQNRRPSYLDLPPMAFQMYDTFLPQWKVGPAAQLYIQKKMPPGEYIGSAFNAPKRNWHRRESTPSISQEQRLQRSEKSASFDLWLKEKEKKKKLEEDLRKKKEDAEKLVADEKRLARVARVKQQRGCGEGVLRDVSSSDLTGMRAGDDVRGGGHEDNKTLIRQMLARYGLRDEVAVSADIKPASTVYEQWLRHQRRMGKPPLDDEAALYSGLLPYQQMIREVCSKKCH